MKTTQIGSSHPVSDFVTEPEQDVDESAVDEAMVDETILDASPNEGHSDMICKFLGHFHPSFSII